MKNINNHILKYLNYSGISHLIRYFSSNKPKIIMYHGIIDNNNQMRCWWQLRESDFKEQMRYLSSEFNVISIDELNESIINRRRLLRNSCVLTFDDGYHSYLTKALPILEYYKLPSVVYISPNVVQKQKMIWTDKLFCAVYRTSKSGLDLSDIELGKWDLETEKKKKCGCSSPH